MKVLSERCGKCANKRCFLSLISSASMKFRPSANRRTGGDSTHDFDVLLLRCRQPQTRVSVKILAFLSERAHGLHSGLGITWLTGKWTGPTRRFNKYSDTQRGALVPDGNAGRPTNFPTAATAHHNIQVQLSLSIML